MLTPELFRKLTPILPYVKVINFDNHGEPLFNLDLEDFIRHSKTVAPKIKTSFTSNFILMSPERAEKVLKAGLDNLQVSIPGITKETYEKIITGGDYHVFINNLNEFKSILRHFPGQRYDYSACVTAMRANLDEIRFIPEFISRLGFNRLRINSVLPFSRPLLNESLLDKREFVERSREVFNDTIQRAKKLKIRANCVLSIEADNIRCHYSEKNFSISYNGDVCPCWMLDIREGYNCHVHGRSYEIPFVKFGNIGEENILEIYNSREFKDFRKDFKSGKMPYFCGVCPVGKRLICG